MCDRDLGHPFYLLAVSPISTRRRIAEAGRSVVLGVVAALTGHSPEDVERILQAHDLGGKFELAEQAVVELEQQVSET
ncbi:hypothetical protein [Bradyrhizobium sp. 27S5]|uniref:hypothetical protein n=1 Tax=Bradyrhizobium sp. 27S5 TaxID=3139728 RepID=UPI0030D3AF6C